MNDSEILINLLLTFQPMSFILLANLKAPNLWLNNEF